MKLNGEYAGLYNKQQQTEVNEDDDDVVSGLN